MIIRCLYLTLIAAILLHPRAEAQGTSIVFEITDLPPQTSMQDVGLRGGSKPLSWDKTLFFKGDKLPVKFPDTSTQVEYKYVIDNGESVIWESIDNRKLKLSIEDKSVKKKWNKLDPIDITKLPLINPDQLQEDFLLIEEMILNVHPGTYRYNEKETITLALSELKQKFSEPISIGEAYIAMSKLTATLKCDHTKVGFNNQSQIVNAIIHEQSDKLPFTFKWFDKKMFIDMNASQHAALQRGTEVLSINGFSVKQIHDELIAYIAADGGTDGNREYKLNVEGYDFRYSAFDVFFPLAFPLHSKHFDLEVIDTKKNKVDLQVAGMHREERAKVLASRYGDFPKTRDDMWTFEIQEGIGILTLNSFGLLGWKAMTLDYKKFLAEAFSELRKQNIDKLIIDIRKNNGGMDEMKDELFSYLDFDPMLFSKIDREGRTRFTHFPESLRPYVQTWGNPWFFELEADRVEEDYFIFLEARQNQSAATKKENYFQGKTSMLCGPANTSLAFYCARQFQQLEIGPLIGEETGGNLRDINGGQILFLRLPKSGIEIDFPVMGSFTKGKIADSGVIPDIQVLQSLEDFINHNDVQMHEAIKYMKK